MLALLSLFTGLTLLGLSSGRTFERVGRSSSPLRSQTSPSGRLSVMPTLSHGSKFVPPALSGSLLLDTDLRLIYISTSLLRAASIARQYVQTFTLLAFRPADLFVISRSWALSSFGTLGALFRIAASTRCGVILCVPRCPFYIDHEPKDHWAENVASPRRTPNTQPSGKASHSKPRSGSSFVISRTLLTCPRFRTNLALSINRSCASTKPPPPAEKPPRPLRQPPSLHARCHLQASNSSKPPPHRRWQRLHRQAGHPFLKGVAPPRLFLPEGQAFQNQR